METSSVLLKAIAAGLSYVLHSAEASKLRAVVMPCHVFAAAEQQCSQCKEAPYAEVHEPDQLSQYAQSINNQYATGGDKLSCEAAQATAKGHSY